MTENISYRNRTLAIIIRKGEKAKETVFITPHDYPMQLGMLRQEKGGIIKPHIHKKNEKTVTMTQEVLFIRRGKLEADFYDEGGSKVASCVLNDGDIIFLASGGHGFKALEDTEMVEVKQGPYSGVEADKERIGVG